MDQAIEQVHVPPWAWVLVGLAVFAVYLMSQENGVLMKSAAGTLHEFFHDGRHFLGVPCH